MQTFRPRSIAAFAMALKRNDFPMVQEMEYIKQKKIKNLKNKKNRNVNFLLVTNIHE